MIKLKNILSEIRIQNYNQHKKEILGWFIENNHSYLLQQVIFEINSGNPPLSKEQIDNILDDFGYDEDFIPILYQQIKSLSSIIKPHEIYILNFSKRDNTDWEELHYNYKYLKIEYLGDGEFCLILSNAKF